MSFKNIFCFSIIFISANLNAGCPYINKKVPFQDVTVNQSCTMNASYQFGNNAMIFCYTDSASNFQGRIVWNYKNKSKSSFVPILLTTNSIFQGELADKNGGLFIRNNQNKRQQFNCVFAN